MIQPAVSGQTAARGPRALIVSPRHLLVRDAPPPPLHKDVVKRSAAAIHADPHPALRQPLGEGHTRQRRPWIGSENLRSASWSGLVQRLQTKRHVHGDRDGPGPHLPAAPIDHRHARHKARGEADRGASRTPDLIDPAHRDPPSAIGGDRVARGWLAQPGLGIDGLQPHLPPQPTGVLGINAIALAPQPSRHPAYPITRRRGIWRVQSAHQRPILGTLADRLIVHARPCPPQQRALPAETHRGRLGLTERPFRLHGQGQLFFSASPARLSAGRSAGTTRP